MTCFFCDVQKNDDDKKIIDNDLFFSRFDDFRISSGHAEIIPKKHIESFFDLSAAEISALFDLLAQTRLIIDKKFKPDGYNIGLNEGRAAGRTIDHVHVHLIPRYRGDAKNASGGIRNIIDGNGAYLDQMKKLGVE